MHRNTKLRSAAAGCVALAASLVAAADTSASAADYNLYSYVYDNSTGAQNGHAGASSASDWKHGWVCDDRSDGYPVYATFYFEGTIGDTQTTLKAPADGEGCADGNFTKHIKYFQVYYKGDGGKTYWGNVSHTPYDN